MAPNVTKAKLASRLARTSKKAMKSVAKGKKLSVLLSLRRSQASVKPSKTLSSVAVKAKAKVRQQKANAVLKKMPATKVKQVVKTMKPPAKTKTSGKTQLKVKKTFLKAVQRVRRAKDAEKKAAKLAVLKAKKEAQRERSKAKLAVALAAKAEARQKAKIEKESAMAKAKLEKESATAKKEAAAKALTEAKEQRATERHAAREAAKLEQEKADEETRRLRAELEAEKAAQPEVTEATGILASEQLDAQVHQTPEEGEKGEQGEQAENGEQGEPAAESVVDDKMMATATHPVPEAVMEVAEVRRTEEIVESKDLLEEKEATNEAEGETGAPMQVDLSGTKQAVNEQEIVPEEKGQADDGLDGVHEDQKTS